MATQPALISTETSEGWNLSPLAHFPGLRVLAWDGDLLYASRGYELLRARIGVEKIIWSPVGTFDPGLGRRATVVSRLTARLCRDGFHALAVLPSGHLVAAVPGAIVALWPGEKEFRVTHRIIRGTRPLHFACTPGGDVFWGEYFDNRDRGEVHVFRSGDCGASWEVIYTFPRGAVRHIHNVVYDRWRDCLWIATGDDGEECKILQASPDVTGIEVVLSGTQQARAVSLVPMSDGLYFSSDTPLESNHIYRLDRRGNVQTLGDLSSSSIYGCRVGDALFFSTMTEPSEVNTQREVRLFGSVSSTQWQEALSWRKDRWPMNYFQYGNAILPDGDNNSGVLALTTVAVEGADCHTTLWNIERHSGEFEAQP